MAIHNKNLWSLITDVSHKAFFEPETYYSLFCAAFAGHTSGCALWCTLHVKPIGALCWFSLLQWCVGGFGDSVTNYTVVPSLINNASEVLERVGDNH